MIEGAALRQVDDRKKFLELAVDIGNVQNSKNPKRAIRTAGRQIEKSENEIINHINGRKQKINLDALAKINKMFGGET